MQANLHIFQELEDERDTGMKSRSTTGLHPD